MKRENFLAAFYDRQYSRTCLFRLSMMMYRKYADLSKPLYISRTFSCTCVPSAHDSVLQLRECPRCIEFVSHHCAARVTLPSDCVCVHSGSLSLTRPRSRPRRLRSRFVRPTFHTFHALAMRRTNISFPPLHTITFPLTFEISNGMRAQFVPSHRIIFLLTLNLEHVHHSQ